MKTFLAFLLLILALFILKTAWPTAGVFAYIQAFLLLTAYLGFEHSLAIGGILTIIMGVLDSTFSGESGAMFLLLYGIVLLICYFLHWKTNLVLMVYQMIVVLLCSLLAGALMAMYIRATVPSAYIVWGHIIISSVVTAGLVPIFFPLFRWIESSVDRLTLRLRVRETA